MKIILIKIFHFFTGFSTSLHLNHLTIHKQNIKNLTRPFLKGLSDITYLDLKGNNIEHVDQNAFDDVLNLNYLILSDNNITQFMNNTFDKLKSLESLEFLRLDLQYFNITMLEHQKELKTIGIPTTVIRDMLQLTELTGVLKKLETIILSEDDKDDEDINNFILNCEDAGFTVKFG